MPSGPPNETTRSASQVSVMRPSYPGGASGRATSLPRLVLPLRAVDRPPLLLLPPLQLEILPDLERAQLRAELVVACQTLLRHLARLHRGADGTAGLGAVGAVAEAAGGGEAPRPPERGGQPLLAGPELDLSQPRGVDQQRAARQRDQLPVRGRVAPALVARAHLARPGVRGRSWPATSARSSPSAVATRKTRVWPAVTRPGTSPGFETRDQPSSKVASPPRSARRKARKPPAA